MAPLLTFLIFFQWISHSACLRGVLQNPLGTLDDGHRLRLVSKDDLDDFVTTYIDAFSPGPLWQYLHIKDERLANYTWACTRAIFEEQLRIYNETRTTVNVITVPQKDSDHGGRAERVVSFAVWNWILPGEQLSRDVLRAQEMSMQYLDSTDCSQHLDTNATRAANVHSKFEGYMDRYIYNATQTQLYLALLATHPDWDGHGFGAEQLEVGLKMAAAREAPSTLIATPAGYPLYDSMGFRSLANLTLAATEDFGTIWLEYMRADVE